MVGGELAAVQGPLHAKHLAKVPHKEKGRFAAHVKQIWLAPDKKSARRAAESLVEEYGRRFPEAVRCLEEGLEDSLSFFDFPEVDRKRSSGTLLSPINRNVPFLKGPVRFPFDRPIPVGLVKKIVAFRVKQNLKKKR
jgi:hypothetical protein